ncbi:MAG: Dabb family protein [Robiginitalea sp.]
MKTFPTVVFLLGVLFMPRGLFAQDTDTTFDPTYAHVVYFWLRNPDNPEECKEFEEAVRELMAKSRYTKTNFLGRPPRATREVVDDSFTYNMIVTFESAAAQSAYQEEQVHLDFIAAAGHLWKKVVVYDALGLTP